MKPNILLILTDDQGRADYSAFGTPDIETPNIDSIFNEGITFDNFYANSPVCSPTRAALLTGCHPDRVGVPGVIRHTPENSWGYLSPKVLLLPQLLGRAGYHCALIGKWHLGLSSPNTPNERGFHYFRGFLGDMMDDYWTHRRGGHNFMRQNFEEIDPPGHATDLFTDWACEYLEERSRLLSRNRTGHGSGSGHSPGSGHGPGSGHSSGSSCACGCHRHVAQPFFLYLAYNAPHDPIQPPPEWLERVEKRESGMPPGMTPQRRRMVALLEHLDAGIGRVLATLKRTGLEENTLVVFTSDNGGLLRRGADNGPWRGEKGHVYEGGIRVPMAARWPGRITPGSRTTVPGMTMDLYPTIAAVAGIAPPPGIDGRSLLPVMTGEVEEGQEKEREEEREFYFVRREGGETYGGKTIEALRLGRWKLLQDSPFGPLELYDMENDPLETQDVAGKCPEVVRELAARLRRHIQKGGEVPWQASQTPSDPSGGLPASPGLLRKTD